ncbi:type II toxin-antitoxin system VapC family toxin [Candidatus Margulisiibacteriota bacterium]
MYLIDTNIFLEILLNQEKKEKCKKFLKENSEELYISDFSLHSIGVILFRYNKKDVYEKFIKDFLPILTVLTNSDNGYIQLVSNCKKYKLDFDDGYQLTVAEENYLKIATLDNDFKKIKKNIIYIL